MTRALIQLLDKLSEKQKQAANERKRDVIVTAGAGSGKTHTLVARFLTLLDDGYRPEEIAAITFTDKASLEMKSRVRSKLIEISQLSVDPEEREKWLDRLNAMDSARIGTIHSLCSQILKTSFAEAGIDPDFSVLDEKQCSMVKVRAIEEWLEFMTEKNNFHPLFQTFRIDEIRKILAGMLDRRLETKGIFERTFDLQSMIHEKLQELFSDENVRTQFEWIAGLNPAELTADAGDKLAMQLDEFIVLWKQADAYFREGDSFASIKVLQAAYTEKMKLSAGKATSEAKRALKIIREYLDLNWKNILDKNNRMPSKENEDQYQQLIDLFRIAFQGLLKQYQDIQHQQTVLDFDDLEEKTLIVLENPAVRKIWREKIRAVLVDEFQDTNYRQQHLLEIISDKPGSFFAVGDARQSIYRFRGADVTVFRSVQRGICMKEGLSIDLDSTYRTDPDLLDASGEFLSRLMGTQDIPNKSYWIPFAPLASMRTRIEQPKEPELEFLLGYDPGSVDKAKRTSAAQLAARLQELKNSDFMKSWDDVALLFRASSGFAIYESVFEKSGIPFVTVSGKGFYDRPEIRDILNMLSAVANPADDLTLAGMLLSPVFHLSKNGLFQLRWPNLTKGGKPEKPANLWESLQNNQSILSANDKKAAERVFYVLQELFSLSGRASVETVLSKLIQLTKYRSLLASMPNKQFSRNVDKLISDAHHSGMISLNDFLSYLRNLNDSGTREGEAPSDAIGAVRLITIHKSKGLEFPIVVVADAAHQNNRSAESWIISQKFGIQIRTEPESIGYILAEKDEKEQNEAELKRLLYVAFTRAKDKLIISGHFTEKRLNGWISELLDPWKDELSEIREQSQRQMKTRDGKPFLVRIATSSQQEIPIYEKQDSDNVSCENEQKHLSISLMQKISSTTSAEFESEPAEIQEGILGKKVGILVHKALEIWTFPQETGFSPLMEQMSIELKELTESQQESAIQRTIQLLSAFQESAIWQEINAADARYHEIPYDMPGVAYPEHGVIDLLYRFENQWKILDFKTDAIRNPDERFILEKSYTKQIRRYERAAKLMLRCPVSAAICFLDDCGKTSVFWKNDDLKYHQKAFDTLLFP